MFFCSLCSFRLDSLFSLKLLVKFSYFFVLSSSSHVLDLFICARGSQPQYA